MNKKLLMGLTTAMVMGAASTTFAAANPFSDVPAGHWAYDAVTQLAADGIIEGYGDGTFLGNRNITRYEMAQMVAKALARAPQATGTDRAALDRLSAEFADELSNLGVRVSELEKYADKVVWHGELRYRYWSQRTEQADRSTYKKNTENFQLRLLPTATVNDHWKLKARLQAANNMKTSDSGDFRMIFGYAEGTYDKFKLNVGKMPIYSNVDDGLVIDDFFSGAQVEVGSKVKFLAEAGRLNSLDGNDPASYQGGEISYDNDKFYIGGSYRHFNSDDFKSRSGYKANKDDANIWSAGMTYKIGSSLKVAYSYADNTKADDYHSAWNAGLSYKGADRSKGSWGMSAFYRRLGDNAALIPTYDTAMSNAKGVDIGLTWAPFKNSLTAINYFMGESLETDRDVDVLFGRVSFFF